MPRNAKPTAPTPADTTLILDNGANTIKAGFSTHASPVLIPNTLAKLPTSRSTLVGTQLNTCKDFAEMVFRRPVQHGQLVNWEAEREIWSHSFFEGKNSTVFEVDPGETNLLLAEAPNVLGNLREHTDQIVMEEWEFKGYRRVVGPVLNAYGDVAGLMGDRKVAQVPDGEGAESEAMNVDQTATAAETLAAECVLVVDSGYSHTTVTPVWKGRPIQQAIRRLEIGGKFLTNCLKDMISLRQLDLSHEFHIVNEMKEDVCFVTRDFKKDLEKTWKQSPHYDGKKKPVPKPPNEDNGDVAMELDVKDTTEPVDTSIVVDYVLPDYTTTFRGRVQPHNPTLTKPSAKLQQQLAAGGASDTTVTLGNERFVIPELMFSPSDIGMPQAGLPEAIMQSIRATPPGLWTAMLSNVIVVGGNALISGFADRLYDELRPLAPAECVVRVKRAGNPITNSWKGGAQLVERAKEAGRLAEVFVTRAEYQEHGEGWLMRQFAGEKHLPA